MGPGHYLQYLPVLHAEIEPEVYLEVGTESGASLSFSRATSIAVDPAFKIDPQAFAGKSQIYLFQQKSDDFFASDIMGRLGHKVDLAFLDGMHLFEYLLRDFINTERLMNRDGVIAMHDCVPFTRLAAEREWDPNKTVSWVGDVWKIIPILKIYRPDLRLDVLSLAPSGLVCVRGLNPDNRVLSDNYDRILAEYSDLDLDGFGAEKFTSLCAPVDPFASRALTEATLVVNTSTPDESVQESWGDHHFGVALTEAFQRQGRATDLRNRDRWRAEIGQDEIALTIRGHGDLRSYPPDRGFMWVIYPGKPPVTTLELEAMGHVFVASHSAVETYAQRIGPDRVSYLPQAFDGQRMFPPAPDAPREGMVFVGNNHFRVGALRPMVSMALECGAQPAIWGRQWNGTPAAGHVRADLLPNAQLGAVYRGAEIVLCDHTKAMAGNGFVSNRIFDALACGAAVICDRVPGLPDGFSDHVWQVSNSVEFEAALAEIRAESAEIREARRAFALRMAQIHSFDARARQILSVLYGRPQGRDH